VAHGVLLKRRKAILGTFAHGAPGRCHRGR
jgi:hypothetical protein